MLYQSSKIGPIVGSTGIVYRFSLNRILNVDHIREMMQQFIQKIWLMRNRRTVNGWTIIIPVIMFDQIEFFVLVYLEQITVQ